MSFFRDRVGGALGLVRVKALVMGLFAVYLVVSLVGLTQLEEGLERKRLARYDSYSAVFFDLEDSYFRDYPYRISVRVRQVERWPNWHNEYCNKRMRVFSCNWFAIC